LLGVSSTPVYLGFGPAEYFDPALKIPEPIPYDTPPTPEQIQWLRRNGVTHVLSFTPLELHIWPAHLIWSGDDRFLNLAWNRYHEPDPLLFLYELHDAPGRAYWQAADNTDAVRFVRYLANEAVIETTASGAGTLVLSDLDYPGWRATIDGRPIEQSAGVARSLHRAASVEAAGLHSIVWTYHPRTVYWGGVVSAVTLFVLLAVGHVRYWHPRFVERLLRR
jgi:hypothetical protein